MIRSGAMREGRRGMQFLTELPGVVTKHLGVGFGGETHQGPSDFPRQERRFRGNAKDLAAARRSFKKKKKAR